MMASGCGVKGRANLEIFSLRQEEQTTSICSHIQKLHGDLYVPNSILGNIIYYLAERVGCSC